MLWKSLWYAMPSGFHRTLGKSRPIVFVKTKIDTSPVGERRPNERGLRAIKIKAFNKCLVSTSHVEADNGYDKVYDIQGLRLSFIKATCCWKVQMKGSLLSFLDHCRHAFPQIPIVPVIEQSRLCQVIVNSRYLIKLKWILGTSVCLFRSYLRPSSSYTWVPRSMILHA